MSEKTVTNEIAVRENKPTALDFPALMKMAETLVKSGFLPQAIKTPAQAVAIVMTGRELGIPPMQALRQVNVIQGKPTMAAELMLALAYQHIPGFKYEILETTNEKCVCKFTRPGHVSLTHKFDINDAKAMQLAGKDNWKKQPATMLRWRCISSGLRLIAPDAIAGVYTPEEIIPDAPVTEEGTIVDVEPDITVASLEEKFSEEIKGIDAGDNAALDYLIHIGWLKKTEKITDLSKDHKEYILENIIGFKEAIGKWIEDIRYEDIERADNQRKQQKEMAV
jgi:hypothetical protein